MRRPAPALPDGAPSESPVTRGGTAILRPARAAKTARPNRRARVGDCDQSKWIDALTLPALVLPKPARGGRTEFDTRTATNRTPVVGMTLDTHRFAYGIVGDKGPVDQLGEASVAMNRDLNGLPLDANPASYRDAIRRFQGPRSAILLFPGATHQLARPLTRDRVVAATQALFERWGGRPRLDACLRELP